MDNISNDISSVAQILIIEDNELISRMYEQKLSSDGFKVVTAANGEEGLVAARSQKIDLILSDVMMPVKDGFAVLNEVKADPELSKIPFVILTNVDDEEAKAKCAELAVPYWEKDQLDPAEVVTRVKEILTK